MTALTITEKFDTSIKLNNLRAMDIEKLKNEIALKHGYQDGILGSPWEFAMQLTHRTKRQIALYEEVIEALANSSHENSGLHKHFVTKRYFWIDTEGKPSKCWDEETHKKAVTKDDIKYAEDMGWKLMEIEVTI